MLVKISIMMYPLIVYVDASAESELIVDYFTYKKVSSVVRFFCSSFEDNLAVSKGLNRNNLALSVISELSHDTNFYAIAYTDHRKIGVFIDSRDQDHAIPASLFLQASEEWMYDGMHSWLVLSSHLDDILNIIDDRAFGFSTDFVVACLVDYQIFELYDIYNVFKHHGEQVRVTFLGNWSKEEGLHVASKGVPVLRQANLHGLILRASFFKTRHKPEGMQLGQYFEDYAYTTRDSFSRYGYHILLHVSDMYNFTLGAYEAPAWEPGDLVGPVARDIWNNTADVTGTALVITLRRAEVVKFVHHAWQTRSCFIFRNPQPKRIKIQEVLKPFHDNVWYLMFTVLIVALSIMTMILRLEGYVSVIERISNSLLIIIGALCQQCSEVEMYLSSTRIFFLTLLIYSFIMYDYYSSSVVSARLDEPIFKINDSLDQLGELHLKLASEWFNSVDYFMKGTDWEHRNFHQNHWNNIPEEAKYMLPEIAVELIREGGFAYHAHPEVAYPYIDKSFSNREICELMEVHVINPTLTSFAVPLNSSMGEILRIGLMRISEVGLRNRQVLRWSFKKPVCEPSILSVSSIDMDEFAPHLLLLLIGMIASIVTCALEISLEYCGTMASKMFPHILEVSQ
ncbi:hypothetical protein QAD02_006601 [Eretmocerus hayati]|uniref:Uncharacterized protein n=1 Tax=Eretmocerus hayati TaxID=131215 RepID=A0ACC2N3P7_9HYME|nr:hypothetical protein QAD02_006601 [Eretmocerus hayati]